jgi:hypothetical protein
MPSAKATAGRCNDLRYNRSDVGFAAGYGFASGFPAADAERRSVGGVLGFELLADESRARPRGPARRAIVTAVTDSSLDEE